jgi:hypothetical protein
MAVVEVFLRQPFADNVAVGHHTTKQSFSPIGMGQDSYDAGSTSNTVAPAWICSAGPHMPSSPTTPGRASTSVDVPVRVAFRNAKSVGARDEVIFAAQ